MRVVAHCTDIREDKETAVERGARGQRGWGTPWAGPEPSLGLGGSQGGFHRGSGTHKSLVRRLGLGIYLLQE